jgi:hypothetical protein
MSMERKGVYVMCFMGRCKCFKMLLWLDQSSYVICRLDTVINVAYFVYQSQGLILTHFLLRRYFN